MKKIFLYLFSIVLILNTQYVNASSSDAQKWLNEEISTIIELYRNQDIDKFTRLKAIQNSVNENFAGTGIARFVVGSVWDESTEESRNEFIRLFKEHLYLTIGSLMRGYSNQNFELINSKKDQNQGVYLIDMEIEYNDQKTLVTWRVKESKQRFYVIDLLVADISLVRTKRAEFNSILKKFDNNLDELNFLLKTQNSISFNNLTN